MKLRKARTNLSDLEQLCGIFYDIAKQVLSGLRTFFSESVVSHLVLWVSFWVLWFAFGCFWLCLLVLFVGFVLEDTLLLLSLILEHVGTVSQNQYVLMTSEPRARRHELKKKISLLKSARILPVRSPLTFLLDLSCSLFLILDVVHLVSDLCMWYVNVSACMCVCGTDTFKSSQRQNLANCSVKLDKNSGVAGSGRAQAIRQPRSQ